MPPTPHPIHSHRLPPRRWLPAWSSPILLLLIHPQPHTPDGKLCTGARWGVSLTASPQARSHPVLSLSVAGTPGRGPSLGFPGASCCSLRTPRAPGGQAVPSPAPWIHALHPSCDSQAGTFLPQGSEMLETQKKREV